MTEQDACAYLNFVHSKVDKQHLDDSFKGLSPMPKLGEERYEDVRTTYDKIMMKPKRMELEIPYDHAKYIEARKVISITSNDVPGVIETYQLIFKDFVNFFKSVFK